MFLYLTLITQLTIKKSSDFSMPLVAQVPLRYPKEGNGWVTTRMTKQEWHGKQMCCSVFTQQHPPAITCSRIYKCRREVEQHAKEAVLRQLLCGGNPIFKGIRSFVLIWSGCLDTYIRVMDFYFHIRTQLSNMQSIVILPREFQSCKRHKAFVTSFKTKAGLSFVFLILWGGHIPFSSHPSCPSYQMQPAPKDLWCKANSMVSYTLCMGLVSRRSGKESLWQLLGWTDTTSQGKGVLVRAFHLINKCVLPTAKLTFSCYVPIMSSKLVFKISKYFYTNW